MTSAASSAQQTRHGIWRWLASASWDVRRALIITRRELVDMFRDWRIVAPIIILTVIFPSIANWGAGRMLSWMGQFGAEIVGERLVPFLLMVVGFFPMSFSLIIALESFVGEKERRSLEPLMSTPLSNIQLYIGKTLSSTIPPLMGSMLGIAVYLVGVYFNIDYRPPVILLIQILLLTAMQALVMVAGAVVVSSQSTSVRAANLLSSFIIVPVSFLIQLEALIMFWAQYDVLWVILAGLVVIAVVLIRMGVKTFNREELLGRELDELNLFAGIRRWWGLTWATQADDPRRSILQWYREEVFSILGRLQGAMVVLVVAMAAGYLLGMRYGDIYRIPADVFVVDNWYERFASILVETGFTGLGGVLLIIGQNLRVLTIASVLAVFTLGIAAILVLMIPTTLVGYLLTQMAAAGMNAGVLWVALIPHSIIEIPAAILAGAAAIRLGASILAPPPGKTVGEGWIVALSEATRLWFALILPLLLLAAIIEVTVTPWLVRLAATGAF